MDAIKFVDKEKEFITSVIYDYIINDFEFNKEKIQASDISLASYKIAFKETYKTALNCLNLLDESAHNYLIQFIDKY